MPSKQFACITDLVCTVIARRAQVAELHRYVTPKQSVGERESLLDTHSPPFPLSPSPCLPSSPHPLIKLQTTPYFPSATTLSGLPRVLTVNSTAGVSSPVNAALQISWCFPIAITGIFELTSITFFCLPFSS